MPMSTCLVNVSPDVVVPNISSSRNQNICTSGISDNARNTTGCVSESDVMTYFVSCIGDAITGRVRIWAMASKSHPGMNGGGVLRVIPARLNISKYSGSQNSYTIMCVVLGLLLHARNPVALSMGMAR